MLGRGAVTRHEPPEGAMACSLSAAEWFTGECHPKCRVLSGTWEWVGRVSAEQLRTTRFKVEAMECVEISLLGAPKDTRTRAVPNALDVMGTCFK